MTHTELKEAVKEAMKNREAVTLSVLRGIMSAATNELVSSGRKPDEELAEEELATVLRRGAKQRKDSIEQFEKGGRPELAEQERAELAVIESYLPAMMPREEVEAAAKVKQEELGVTDATQKGKLIGALMKDLKGKADGNVVKEVVDGLFE